MKQNKDEKQKIEEEGEKQCEEDQGNRAKSLESMSRDRTASDRVVIEPLRT